MFNHEPPGYPCPFCYLLSGGSTSLDRPEDVVLRTPLASAKVASHGSSGAVIVFPNAHHENLYDLPSADGHAVHDAVRAVAIAMRRAYGCAGTSIRQHNEPVGGQEVWHYHVHVFPHHPGDQLDALTAADGAALRRFL
ncbi:HIT domain-containing protein [Lentzea tibetensis]|uniref:HIT domain-containing protein n=1 Tax=Lentzea tibetensis TaxID=2591470 RepID=A0A563EUQ2_9PSEU|nr:HIT domain-containing protein [Lentzea tibetensis]TWP51268.1 HIT domain-containing protein [Lentzea tibetensis]